MLTKPSSDAAPALRPVIKALYALALIAHIAGCSSNTDLAEANSKLGEANQRIAVLEAELARVQAAKPVTSAAPAVVDEPAAASGQQWSYDVTDEKMTGGKRRTASVDSTNTVSFDFPYAGSQNGGLILRIDPRNGKDVLFRIEKGQILCPSYEGCTVQVRFDDEKPSKFSASGAADHSSNIIFLNDYKQFVAKLRKAKRVRLAVGIYQQGAPVFEFDVGGFDFDRYEAKSK